MKQANYLDRIGVCTDCGADVTPGYGADCGAKENSFEPGDAFCAEVAQRIELIKPDWTCYGEFNQCVSVNLPSEMHFWFGTANETWGCDVYENTKAHEDGVIKESLDTGVSEEEWNAQKVAEAIVDTVKRYVSSLEFLDKLTEFRKVAFELSEAWDNLDDQDHANETLCKEYPFKESFDETCHQILHWEEDVENDPAFGRRVK